MIKVFKYIPDLDCFVVESQYKTISDALGLNEWNEVVWIGRFLLMDNDFGEHWFDNWELRDEKANKASELGFDTDDLLILDAERFKNKIDGPCHTDEERLSFWKDVLMSLHLSYDTLFSEARKFNEERKNCDSENYIPDLEERILKLKNKEQ